MTEIACVVACKNKLGEVPVWDVDEGALYWVDIENKLLQRYIPTTGEARRWTLPERIGSFALRSLGGLICALASGFAFFDPGTGEIDWIDKPEAGIPRNRFNDGKCDRSCSATLAESSLIARFWLPCGGGRMPRTRSTSGSSSGN